MSSSSVKLELHLIPLEEIRLATRDFSLDTLIGDGASGKVYKGQLSKRWHNRICAFKRLPPGTGDQGKQEFRSEVEMMSDFNHENIISLIGCCDEGNERIAVFDYASNGGLDNHLHDPNRRRNLTWPQRLNICLAAARGLEYLHDGLGEDRRVIHRDIKSGNILLDENLEAKISNFGLSLLVDKNQPHAHKDVAGTDVYMDPIYRESKVHDTKSDVYSFGIVLFEMLSGMMAHVERVSSDNNDQPQRLIHLVRRYYDDEPDNFVDPLMKDHINIRSLVTFKEIAYQCISWNLKDRPLMSKIILQILEALNIQRRETSTVSIRSRQTQNLEGSLIPLEEIKLATNNFSDKCTIGGGGFVKVYKGQISKWGQNRTAAIKRFDLRGGQGAKEFYKELQMISSFHHQNIIPFFGYCDEGNEMFIVCEYPVFGSLDSHLQNPQKKRCLAWAQRLKICLGAAKGLEYLHSGLEENNRILHRDIKSANILIDDNNEGKISDFGISLLVDRNQLQVYDAPAGTNYYMDPVYRESSILRTESDIFSFGVVLFEVLSGELAYKPRRIGDSQPQTLINLVRCYYDDEPGILIDPFIKDEVDIHSFRVFIKIAYRCISYNLKDRPTIKRIIRRINESLEIQERTNMAQGAASTILTRSPKNQDLASFQIPLVDIIFSREPHNRIGDGGFGKVYKGQLSKSLPDCEVAIKCLDPDGHQGKKEFLTEVELISSFHHQNIIPFVGYCNEGDEMIMISRYATNGSLDHHLRDPSRRNLLSWERRLKICLGAAKGLDYLHSGLGKDRVIHRDVKSGNILLDEEYEAKLCDFGLSKKGPIDHHTQIYTKAAGTMFYLDPAYHESGILSKESDVYSFGVVLFEMLSGRLAYSPTEFVDGNPQYLIILVRRYYNHEPKKLIDPDIRDEIDSQCFDTFINLAYKCISLKPDERPTMDTIIDGIEDAMEFQKLQSVEGRKAEDL